MHIKVIVCLKKYGKNNHGEKDTKQIKEYLSQDRTHRAQPKRPRISDHKTQDPGGGASTLPILPLLPAFLKQDFPTEIFNSGI